MLCVKYNRLFTEKPLNSVNCHLHMLTQVKLHKLTQQLKKATYKTMKTLSAVYNIHV